MQEKKKGKILKKGIIGSLMSLIFFNSPGRTELNWYQRNSVDIIGMRVMPSMLAPALNNMLLND